jgi:ribosome maturation factor RimP
MDLPARVAEIVAPSIAAMGYELVRVQLLGDRAPVLQVMAERSDRAGMTVEDCAQISRAVSAVLDVEDPIDGTYTLEVSSPGIDRPLIALRDFERFSGHLAKVETRVPVDGRKRFRGALAGIEGEAVRLDLADDGTVLLPHAQISRAKLVLTDDLLAAMAAESGTAG